MFECICADPTQTYIFLLWMNITFNACVSTYSDNVSVKRIDELEKKLNNIQMRMIR